MIAQHFCSDCSNPSEQIHCVDASVLRLVFASNGVGVGVVIRNAECFDLVKTSSDSAYNFVAYNPVKTRLSESEGVAEELNQS